MHIESPQITVELRHQLLRPRHQTSPPSSQGQRGNRRSGGGRGQSRTIWTGNDKQAPLFQQAETTALRSDDRPAASSSRIMAAQDSKSSRIDRIHSSDSPPSGSNSPPAYHLPPWPNIPQNDVAQGENGRRKEKKEWKEKCKKMDSGILVGLIVMGSS
ncbi:hypothetical protein FRC02_000368 [Tulasnella sp. 418]|nr:hypothetical protein FRC02_000368 [Tulasnella sp. 418]